MFKISLGNTKLGAIPNINLSTSICEELKMPCYKNGCYACKGHYRYSTVQNRYKVNTEEYFNNPDKAFKEISEQLPDTGRIRWHSSGEIPNLHYLFKMVEIAEKHNNLKFLCYTKRYQLVNIYLYYGYKIPDNLTIVFSEWEGYNMNNPYSLPVAQVKEFNNKYMGKRIIQCTGHCNTCGICWNLKRGDIIQFKKH